MGIFELLQHRDILKVQARYIGDTKCKAPKVLIVQVVGPCTKHETFQHDCEKLFWKPTEKTRSTQKTEALIDTMASVIHAGCHHCP